jgi:hypothetical protein
MGVDMLAIVVRPDLAWIERIEAVSCKCTDCCQAERTDDNEFATLPHDILLQANVVLTGPARRVRAPYWVP